jgi:hypothetical protein
VFLKRCQVAILDVCNVRAIKFLMVPTTHRSKVMTVYMLPQHAKDGIREAIATLS